MLQFELCINALVMTFTNDPKHVVVFVGCEAAKPVSGVWDDLKPIPPQVSRNGNVEKTAGREPGGLSRCSERFRLCIIYRSKPSRHFVKVVDAKAHRPRGVLDGPDRVLLVEIRIGHCVDFAAQSLHQDAADCGHFSDIANGAFQLDPILSALVD
jgi:hypothetical protein